MQKCRQFYVLWMPSAFLSEQGSSALVKWTPHRWKENPSSSSGLLQTCPMVSLGLPAVGRGGRWKVSQASGFRSRHSLAQQRDLYPHAPKPVGEMLQKLLFLACSCIWLKYPAPRDMIMAKTPLSAPNQSTVSISVRI